MSDIETYGKKRTMAELVAENVVVVDGKVVDERPESVVPPVVGKQLSQDIQVAAFVARMVVKNKLVPVESLKVPGAKYGTTAVVGTLMSNNLSFGPIATDRSAWAALSIPKKGVVCGEKQVDQNWAWPAMREARKYTASMGTLPGLLHRVEQGVTREKPVFSVMEAADLAIKGGFVVDASMVPSFKTGDHSMSLSEALGKMQHDVYQPVFVNGKSSSGFPWMKSKGAVSADMILWASKMLEAIALGKWEKFQEENPHLFATALKNKTEVYLWEELQTKTRPYYVYCGALALLWSCVTQRLAAAVPTFLGDEKSSSAIGMSWQEGGATRVAEWVHGTRQVAHRGYLRGAIYADDQLYAVTTEDGVTLVYTPDWKMMDMSLSAQWGAVVYKLFERAIDDKTWRAVFKSCCVMAFNKVVVLPGAATVALSDSLGSGVNFTSYFDLVGSQAALGLLREMFEKTKGSFKTAKSVEAVMQRFYVAAKVKFGLEVKPETTSPHIWMPPGDSEGCIAAMKGESWAVAQKAIAHYSTPWQFLGVSLVALKIGVGITKWKWGVVLPFEKLVRSFVYPKVRGEAALVQRSSAERTRGLALCGGYLYEPFYTTLKLHFEGLLSAGYKPLADDAEDYESSAVLSLPENLPSDYFPTRNWVAQFILGEDHPIVHEPKAAVVAATSTPVVALSAGVGVLQKATADAWADIAEEEEREDSSDVVMRQAPVDMSQVYVAVPGPSVRPTTPVNKAVEKAAVVAPPSTIGLKYLARVPPNLERRAQKRKEYEVRLEQLRLLRERYKLAGGAEKRELRGKGKKQMLSMAALMMNDFPDAEHYVEALERVDQEDWEDDEDDQIQALGEAILEGYDEIWEAEARREHIPERKGKHKGKGPRAQPTIESVE